MQSTWYLVPNWPRYDATFIRNMDSLPAKLFVRASASWIRLQWNVLVGVSIDRGTNQKIHQNETYIGTCGHDWDSRPPPFQKLQRHTWAYVILMTCDYTSHCRFTIHGRYGCMFAWIALKRFELILMHGSEYGVCLPQILLHVQRKQMNTF